MQIKVVEKYIPPYYSNAEEKEYSLADGEEHPESDWSEEINGKEVIHIILSCDHVDYNWESTEVDTMRNGEHDTYEVAIAVCSNWECGKVLDIEQEDPNDE